MAKTRRGDLTMKNKEKREVYFFSRLAKALYEDVEALDALHYCHSFSDILTTLQCYGYLKAIMCFWI